MAGAGLVFGQVESLSGLHVCLLFAGQLKLQPSSLKSPPEH